jgi:hypothetical protein
VTIIETWPMAFDPIQLLLGVSGLAALVSGLTIWTTDARKGLGRRVSLIGLGLLGATVLYSLVLTWTKVDSARR